MRSGQDGVAVFGAAIAALEKEAADLDRRAAAARALLQQLRAHASAAAAVNIPRQNSRKPDPPKVARGHQQACHKRPAPVASAAGTKVEELKKLVAEIAKLDGLIKAEKNAAAIKAHVAALLRAERRGGELVAGLAGAAKLPIIGDLQRRRWRRLAALTPKQFAQRIERAANAALAALKPAQPKPPSAEPAQPKRLNIGPAPPMKKLSEWHTDETGALSRELSAT